MAPMTSRQSRHSEKKSGSFTPRLARFALIYVSAVAADNSFFGQSITARTNELPPASSMDHNGGQRERPVGRIRRKFINSPSIATVSASDQHEDSVPPWQQIW
ncbi:hypothetical protein CEXT_568571 [Caerostris extrusa]|uniref:Uncharacterized protein n=1 Tax=Caerostris extrusa TaxID=172846 RepID=A0AAV4YCG9_CAEEX|nr:hypothetical protein CEXT_568571 [Caerostris extrusa]